MYIYREREIDIDRERERDRCVCVDTCMYSYIYAYIYIYIYICQHTYISCICYRMMCVMCPERDACHTLRRTCAVHVVLNSM